MTPIIEPSNCEILSREGQCGSGVPQLGRTMIGVMVQPGSEVEVAAEGYEGLKQ